MPNVFATTDAGFIVEWNPETGAIVNTYNLGRVYRDIAIAPDGQVYGITFSGLYLVDLENETDSLVGALRGNLGDGVTSTDPDNPLTVGANGNVTLSGANGFDISDDGTGLISSNNLDILVEVDIGTGAITPSGSIGNTTSGGDLVFFQDSVYVSAANGQLLQLQIAADGKYEVVGSRDLGFGNIFALAEPRASTNGIIAFVRETAFDLGAAGEDTQPGALIQELQLPGTDVYGAATMVNNQIFEGNANNNTITGSNGPDLIYGREGDDTIFAGLGNDTVFGDEGVDRLFGGAGNDVIRGGTNAGFVADSLFGEDGNDTLFGDTGFDTLNGGNGDDLLNGGGQADNMFGGAGNDVLIGEGGLDRGFGGEGNDLVRGGEGNDGHFGQEGDDTLEGGNGNDRFFGGIGNDLIMGEADNDTIFADAGFDTLDGGTGNDELWGKFNADTFLFSDGHGQDTIKDFDAGNALEKIDLSNVSAITDFADLSANHLTQIGGNVLIDTGAGNSILLEGVALAGLDGTDFIF